VRAAWLTGTAAVALAAAAIAVAVVTHDGGTGPATDPPRTTTTASSDTLLATTTPSTPTSAAPTTTPLPAGITTAIAESALPPAADPYEAAEQPVMLTAICAGAALEAVPPSTAVYASLQTTDVPLRFLDAGIVVYSTGESAQLAFTRLVAELQRCPPDRTATPTPSGTVTPSPVQVTGEVLHTTIGDVPAVQWVQLQTSADPETSLRTVVTVLAYRNAIVAVSMDEDSESTSAEELASASQAAAADVIARLRTAVTG
jgi:hypothetical protein